MTDRGRFDDGAGAARRRRAAAPSPARPGARHGGPAPVALRTATRRGVMQGLGPMRRPAILLLTLLLVHAPPALAAAGGGSSSYSGGGGGGGGFSGGGGSSSSSGGGGGLVVIALVVIVVLVLFVAGVLRERRRRRRRDARAAQARAAALEAAQDDAAFDPDHVVPAAGALFRATQEAWTARDRARLATLCAPDLLVEWERRLDDFDRRGWHNQVTVVGEPEIHYVGLVNRERDADDQVVVLVEATLRDVVVDAQGNRIKRNDSDRETTTLREYWTLGKRDDDRWTLRSIEQLGEGDHHLDSALVASPWSDDRIREDAVLEHAAADAAAPGTDVAALVDLDFAGDGRQAALDLSLVDGRFAPEVLETCARRAVAAWAEAVDGADAALEAVAAPAAVAALLYPRGGDAVRRVVRGPRLERMTLVALDGERHPPQMVVELRLAGRRYLEDRDTIAVVEGSRDAERRWTERWSFALDDAGGAAAPWSLVSATDAPGRRPPVTAAPATPAETADGPGDAPPAG